MMEEATLNQDASPEERIEALLAAEDDPEQQEEATDAVQEPEPEAEEEEPEEQEVETDEEDTETIELDAEQLADILKVSPDSLILTDTGEIKLRTKVDGQPGEATLQDLVKSYQLESHVNAKSMRLAEQQRQFEADAQAQRQAIEAQLTQTGALLQGVEQQLLGEYNSVDWNTLRAQDPGEYAALRQTFEEKANAIQAAKSQALQVAQQQMQMRQQQTATQRQKMLAEEAEMLTQKLPEWMDGEKAASEKQELVSYLKSEGYPDEALSQLFDHKMVITARKAMLWDKAQSQTKTAKKLVKNKPRVVRAGTVKSKTQKAADAYQRDISKYRKSQSKKKGADIDAAAALIEKYYIGD